MEEEGSSTRAATTAEGEGLADRVAEEEEEEGSEVRRPWRFVPRGLQADSASTSASFRTRRRRRRTWRTWRTWWRRGRRAVVSARNLGAFVELCQ